MALSSRPRTVYLAKLQQSLISYTSVTHRRPFHVTSPNLLLNETFAATHSLFQNLHTVTGLPWVVTLPVTGFIIRFFVIGPISTYSHIIGQRRTALQPLKNAWLQTIRRKTVEEHSKLGPSECNRIVSKTFAAKTSEIDSRHGTQIWKGFLPYIQIPVFLTMIETLRKMCDTNPGLLGLLIRSTGNAENGDPSNPEEQIDHSKVLLEPSLANEGALWFPDLLVPDPLLILPFILSGSLLANIFYHSRQVQSKNKWQRRINNSLKILALAIGPLTLQVPSAMIVYWISTSAFALGYSVILQRRIPLVPVVTPCKPPEQQQKLGVTPQK